MKLLKKLRKRWQAWYSAKHNPIVAARRDLLKKAIQQGITTPVGRARRRTP